MRLVVPWSLAAALRWCLRTQPDSHAPFLAAVEDTIQFGASARGWRRNPWPRFWTYDSLAAWVATVRGVRPLEDNKPNQKLQRALAVGRACGVAELARVRTAGASTPAEDVSLQSAIYAAVCL